MDFVAGRSRSGVSLLLTALYKFDRSYCSEQGKPDSFKDDHSAGVFTLYQPGGVQAKEVVLSSLETLAE